MPQGDLYTVSDRILQKERLDSVETKFLSDLDNDAAPVLRKLLEGDLSFSDEERHVWAQFVHALHERSPRVLRGQQEEARRVVRELWAASSGPLPILRVKSLAQRVYL